jgi:hypothetical protein
LLGSGSIEIATYYFDPLRVSAVFDGGAFVKIEGIVESGQGWGMACV